MTATEPWQWGDLFELDVPRDASAHDLGEMIEMRFRGAETPLLLAAFAPISDDPETAVRGALERFAATRGFSDARHGLELSQDPDGIVAGRLSFITDLHWMALAAAWHHGAASGQSSALAIAFSAGSSKEDPIFHHAENLFSTLRPLDHIRSATQFFESPEGDF